MKFFLIVFILLFSNNLFAFDGGDQCSMEGKIKLHKAMIKETKNPQELLNFLEDKAQILTDPNFKETLEQKKQQFESFIQQVESNPLLDDIKALSHITSAQDAVGKIAKILSDIPSEITVIQKFLLQFSCCKGN